MFLLDLKIMKPRISCTHHSSILLEVHHFLLVCLRTTMFYSKGLLSSKRIYYLKNGGWLLGILQKNLQLSSQNRNTPKTEIWKDFLHKRVVQGLGYVPGVCWSFLSLRFICRWNPGGTSTVSNITYSQKEMFHAFEDTIRSDVLQKEKRIALQFSNLVI